MPVYIIDGKSPEQNLGAIVIAFSAKATSNGQYFYAGSNNATVAGAGSSSPDTWHRLPSTRSIIGMTFDISSVLAIGDPSSGFNILVNGVIVETIVNLVVNLPPQSGILAVGPHIVPAGASIEITSAAFPVTSDSRVSLELI